MNRLIAAATVLLLSGTARADMGAPWPISRRVPVRVTITADAPPPGVELLLVPNESGSLRHSTPRPLLAGMPVVLESDGRRFFFDVYRANPPERVHVGGARFDGGLSLFDGRVSIEEVYRVEWQGESVSLRKVSDNTLSWWQSGSCCLCALVVPIGLIWLGVRLARGSPA